MEKISKNQIEMTLKFAQDCLAAVPIIILGSGHSAGFGIPGVPELTAHLRSVLPPLLRQEEDKVAWAKLNDLLQRTHLEAALQEVQLSSQFTNLIIEKTWQYIIPYDDKAFDQILHKQIDPALCRLFNHLFRSTHQRLSVITTNYDRLIEYVADTAGCGWATGFGYGYMGHGYTSQSLTVLKNDNPFRMVDIWKVHGSIDWYRDSDGAVYCLPAAHKLPSGYQPVMVTPGIDKFRRTHEEPFRTIMTRADAALDSGNAFLSIGYGFNDEHIQPKLLEKCKREDKSIVVLTKELTDSAKKVLLDGKCRNFVAFEECVDGTRMYDSTNLRGIELKGEKFWSLDTFLDKIL